MDLEPLIIALRFVQYGGAMILFGLPLFLLCNRPLAYSAHWARAWILWAGATLLIAAPLQFVGQTALLSGSVSALDTATLQAALEMNFGKSSLIRTALAAIVLCGALLMPPGRLLWWCAAILGAAVCASFSWMGHGATTEGATGWVHLAANILHSLAAAGWIGALAAFLALTRPKSTAGIPAPDLHESLRGFAGMGTLFVAVIIATGLINSLFLVGLDPIAALSTRYGQVLALKLVFVMAMLALAARNRFQHVPALRSPPDRDAWHHAWARLRFSIVLENLAAVMVIALVSLLGTLPPGTD